MAGYDLAIAYRIYSQVAQSARGLPSSHDKLQLSEVCLRSLKESLGNLRAKLWVVLDGCPVEYQDLFRKYFAGDDLVLLPLPGIGNQATFRRQIELLLQQQDSDFIYFAEDDYFYLPDQFQGMVDFLRQREDADFVSPYDHLDYYTMELHSSPEESVTNGKRQWKTAASTCLTFLTRRATLAKTVSVFRNYKRRSLDCSLWLSLTKERVFNPFFFAAQLFGNPLFCKIVLKSWLYFWPQILFGKKWRLWVPVPAIATHLDAKALAPDVDWRSLMERSKEGIHGRAPDARYSRPGMRIPPEA